MFKDENEVEVDDMDLEGIGLQCIIKVCQRWDIRSIMDDQSL
jgi:hypothetical protein